ncbi:MAG TPA: CDP-alcohol phosphatidyltransferase family protein [Candidatus Nanoarchaeia archaeon]|nr:CDP-alcohol phosphatidyltransferase family protein [Candidatus Nanoarchaeia archaeon]
MKITLAELEQINQEKYQKNGLIGVFTRKHISTKISSWLAQTPITPTQITFFSLLLGLSGIYLLSTGERYYLIGAGLLIFLSKIFDAVDGEVARLKQRCTPRGAWLDGLSDRFKENLLCLGLALGLFHQTGEVEVWFYSFLAIIGLHMLSLVLEHTGKMDKTVLGQAHQEFWLVKLAKRIGLKPQYLALQADTYLFIIYVSITLNQLWFTLWFIIIAINLYWLAIVVLVYQYKKKEETNPISE